jgi:hypothetical protein
MRLEINFDRNLDDVVDPFAPLPDGEYDAVLEAMEDRDGVFVLPMNLDDGNGNSGKFWDYFRVYHEKKNVAKIHVESLQRLCVVLGFAEIPEDGDDFAGKECKVKLRTKGEFQNVQRYFSAKQGQQAAAKPAAKPTIRPAPKPGPVEVVDLEENIPF